MQDDLSGQQKRNDAAPNFFKKITKGFLGGGFFWGGGAPPPQKTSRSTPPWDIFFKKFGLRHFLLSQLPAVDEQFRAMHK